jgi:hypothetical protein
MTTFIPIRPGKQERIDGGIMHLISWILPFPQPILTTLCTSLSFPDKFSRKTVKTAGMKVSQGGTLVVLLLRFSTICGTADRSNQRKENYNGLYMSELRRDLI